MYGVVVSTSTGGGEDSALDGVAGFAFGSGGGDDDGCSGAGEFSGDEGETLEVFGAVFCCCAEC